MREIAKIPVANFALFTAAVLIVYHVSGLANALLAIPIGSMLALAATVCELRLRKRLNELTELDETLSALHAVYMDVKCSGRSVHSGVEHAASSLNGKACTEVSKTFDEIRRKMLLGQDFGQAINSSSGSKSAASAALRSVGNEYAKGLDAASAVKNVYNRIWKSRMLEREKAQGALQKYMTISMAFSAVVPSFVVFAFIGYSMVYYSDTLLFAFSLAMLFVIPGIYAMLRMRLVGIYAQ